MLNNIKKISEFLGEPKASIIILPKVNEEVVIFYQMLIQKLCKKNNFFFQKIENFKNLVNLDMPSLF